MEIIKYTENENTYQKVTEGNNYLEFILVGGGWYPSIGKIDNISFIMDKYTPTWKKVGRGKISGSTYNKLEAMNKFFRG